MQHVAGDPDFENRTRWLLRVEGFDYGPFTPDELRERIRDGRATLRSELSEEVEGRWVLLEEVPAFHDFCMQLIEEEKERARQAEMDHAETQVRRSHKLAWRVSHFGLIGVLAAGGIAVFFLTRSSNVLPSNFGSAIFYEAELGRIERWEQFDGDRAHEWRFGAEAPRKRRTAAKPKRRRRRARRIGVYEESGGEVAVDFDFVTDDAGSARRLTMDEINSLVVPKAKRLLQGCLEREAARRPGVNSADFRFALLPTGRVTGARVMGRMSGEMHGCTKRSLRRIRIEPFAGGVRWITISLRFTRD